MKLYQLTLMIITILLFSCQSKNNEINIVGVVNGKIPEKIEYTLPVKGVCNYAFKESVKPDSLGNFTIKFKVNKPSFVKIFIPRKVYGTLLVEKGMNYNVKFDLVSKKNLFRVIADNQKGQNLYNSLSNPSWIEAVSRKFSKDSTASVIKEKITKLKEKEQLQFKELFLSKEISEDFYHLVKLDRDTYYSAIQGTVALLKKYEDIGGRKGVFTVEIKNMWKDAVEELFAKNNSLLSSYWYYPLAKNFLQYNEYTNKKFNPNELKEIYKKGLIHTHNINQAKKYLSGGMLEYYEASYLYEACLQRRYEKELIALFDNFKADFPNSEYTKFIEPMVEPIVDYHKKIQEKFSENVKFIELYDKISSLKEAVKSLKGKKVYVDVWATWCSPCKDEFKHKSELKKLLAEKDIQLLYISIDKEERDTQWKNMIKYYNLEGYHIRASKGLDEDLRKLFDRNGNIMIPWYILIDENGNIIKKRASRPSELSKLREEIEV